MLPLDSENRKLQAFLSGAAATTNPTVTVSFYDVPNQSKSDTSDYRRAPQFTVLAGATETDICAAPKQGTVRHIESINIYNADTATVTVTICVDDSGTNRILRKETLAVGASLSWSKESGWQVSTGLSSGMYVLAQSGATVTAPADTSENTLASITVPGGMMGANDVLEIHTTWEATNNANAKTLRVRFSTISGTEFLSNSMASLGSQTLITRIQNANSVSSQVAGGPTGGGVSGSSALATASVNTAVDTTIVITAQKGTSGDTISLKRYAVYLVKV